MDTEQARVDYGQLARKGSVCVRPGIPAAAGGIYGVDAVSEDAGHEEDERSGSHTMICDNCGMDVIRGKLCSTCGLCLTC